MNRLWKAGVLHVLWLVVTRHASSSSAVLATATVTIWKVMTQHGLGYPLDLDTYQRWEMPQYARIRGMFHFVPDLSPSGDDGHLVADSTDGKTADASDSKADSATNGSRSAAVAAAIASAGAAAKAEAAVLDWFPEKYPSLPPLRKPAVPPPSNAYARRRWLGWLGWLVSSLFSLIDSLWLAAGM